MRTLLLALSIAAPLHFGPHAAGFRRIGDVSVWYPAQRSGTGMKLGDYYGASLKPFGLFLGSMPHTLRRFCIFTKTSIRS